MKNTDEGLPISAEEAEDLRARIWGAELYELGGFEEMAIIYSACKGALEDIRNRGQWSVSNIHFLNELDRLKTGAFQGLYASEVDQRQIDAAIEGDLFK